MSLDPQFQIFLTESRQRIEAALEQHLPAETIPPQRLHQAMRYAVLGSGKRVRPVLVYAAGQALGADPATLDGPACAVELIHAYSLVHDDLPAMDDDDLRRGRPTCHKAYDEATAVLTGDALQTLAFKVLCRDKHMIEDPLLRLKMVEELALASGSRGMAGGQALDIDAVGQQIDMAQLENMHIHKTGALIRASVKLGALSAANSSAEQCKQLDRYAKQIGLAFQVKDDILDVEGDTETLGKTQGKDAADDKPTYPALLGLEGARQMADELIDDALDNLRDFDEQAEPLRALARYIIGRQH